VAERRPLAATGKTGRVQLWLHPAGLFAQIKAKFLELARQNKGRAVRR
jgi:hypothetical protein